MFRRFLDTFTATHATAIFIAALFTPGALYAINYSNVSVVDPTTFAAAYIDSGRRLHTYDALAGYTSNPGYLVNIGRQTSSSGAVGIFTIPAGKALILKSFQWDFFNSTVNGDAWVQLSTGSTLLAEYDSDRVQGTDHASYDAGIVVRAGTLTAAWGSNGNAATHNFYIQGYLVPSGAVPAPAAVAGGEAQLISDGARPRQPSP